MPKTSGAAQITIAQAPESGPSLSAVSSPTDSRDGSQVPCAVLELRRPKTTSPACAARPTPASSTLHSRTARPRQHQRIGGCHVPPAGRPRRRYANTAMSSITDGQQADKRMQAWASYARYTPGDQMLALTGSPRVTNGGMATTAKNHPHQPRYRRRSRRGAASRAPTAN